MRVIYSLLALALAGLSFAQSKDVAITGARIEVGDGKTIDSGTVLIHDGKISAVGQNLTSPPGADVIDAKGKVLYPGFIDAYSTRGLKLPDAPAAGTPPDSRSTAPASMWHANRKGMRPDVAASKCLDLKDGLKDNYSVGITTSLVAPGGGTVRGIAAIVDQNDPASVLVASAAGELAIRGGGFGGGGGGGAGGDTGYPGSLLGVVALERQVLIDAQQYAMTTPAKKDDSMENLRPLVTKQIPAIFNADNEREIVRSGQMSTEFGFKLMIGGGHDAYKQIEMLKSKGAAVLVSLDMGTEPPTKASTDPDATPQEVIDERHANWMERNQNIRKLNDAGVPFAFSTLGTNLSDYLKNIRKVIATGLPKDAALKAMTSGAATILGIADKTGTIEVGKMANLVLMNYDFADANSEVQAVFVEGKKIDVKGAK